MKRFNKFYEGIQTKIKQFSYVKFNKIAVLANAAKIVVMATLAIIIPFTGKIQAQDKYQTKIALNQTSADVVSLSNKIEIASTKSNLEANKIAKSQGQIAMANTPADPANFRDLYKAAGAKYGVDWKIIEAVHQVESGKSGSTARTSYAGAQGPMQFMPGTWRAYGEDADGDGVANANNVTDAIYGAAHLLAAGGAAEGNVHDALFNYNHAEWYVTKVMDVANSIQE